jgi:hypothetical protein
MEAPQNHCINILLSTSYSVKQAFSHALMHSPTCLPMQGLFYLYCCVHYPTFFFLEAQTAHTQALVKKHFSIPS